MLIKLFWKDWKKKQKPETANKQFGIPGICIISTPLNFVDCCQTDNIMPARKCHQFLNLLFHFYLIEINIQQINKRAFNEANSFW